MVEQQPARAQQRVHFGEIGVVVVEPDMFEHANGGDLVVFADDVAVVLQLEP